jgi:hypothetical protein
MLENEYFRELVEFLNSSIAALLPPARSTLRNWVMTEYNEQRQVLKAELGEAVSAIHLSFDLWTAPNYLAILSIFGHWIDAHGQRHNKLLAFRRVIGKHGGQQQAEVVLKVLNELAICHKVGCIVGDNASSNDSAIAAILKALHPQKTAKQLIAFRLRCFGHIVNLCAHALIFGKGEGGRRAKLASAEVKGNEEAYDAVWRSVGAVGILHNIIKYI